LCFCENMHRLARAATLGGRLGYSANQVFLLGYASSTTAAKRKVSVSLDEDLVAELEAGDEALSAQVNEAIRSEVERRRRNRLLGEMLDAMDAELGPVDETLVTKYARLLG
jgi:post-segregation antitoxin (ccd killing protein)